MLKHTVTHPILPGNTTTTVGRCDLEKHHLRSISIEKRTQYRESRAATCSAGQLLGELSFFRVQMAAKLHIILP
jgi:hypothetical protein